MHTLHYDLMQARHHDLMRSAARQRLAAQAKAAKTQAARGRGGGAAAEPGRRVLRLIWRLLPA